MKYQVIRACIISGKRSNVGDVVELGDQQAKELMAIGRVTPHDETVIEDRSIGLDNETKPKRRARTKKSMF